MTADLFARDKAIARLRTRVAGLEQQAARAERVAQSAARDAAIALGHQLAAEQRADRAEATLNRVRSLHRDAYPGTVDTGRSCTAGCGTWPCATLTALDPAQQPTA
ncbi:hypothetical protein [Streptomyces sp. NPDC057509]|uniref:hypothetical protein n=1 Tax=Streptomyces sp. NPDC057509 TaxID=3346152 RepID=UPI0036C4A3A5